MFFPEIDQFFPVYPLLYQIMMNETEIPHKAETLKLNDVPFTFDDIHRVVKSFYHKVPMDKHLKVPFSSVEDWPYHIDKLTHFWWTRFGGMAYMDVRYNPVQKHYDTGFNEEFLDIWLKLFKSVLTEELSSEQARIWGMIAQNMGEALNKNNELIKKYYAVK